MCRDLSKFEHTESLPKKLKQVLGLAPSSSLGLLDVVPAVGTLCVALPMYVATAFPSVPGGDSGELIAEACKAKGGVAHPPGYPLYLLLLQAAFKLEVLDGLTPAYIANVENALFAAVAAASITHFVYLYTNKANAFAAIASGLMFAFAPLTWEYAAGAEVFALNNMLLAVLFVLCAVFKRSHSIFAASVGALICGLALSNQHTAILYEVPMIAWMLWHGRYVFRWYHIFCMGMLFVAGLTPYVHLMHESETPSRGSWGNASSWIGLLRHLVREEYGTFKLSPITSTNLTETPWERGLLYLQDAREQFVGIGFILALLGLWRAEGPADETSRPLTDSSAPSTTTRPASTEPTTATPEQRALDDLLLLTFLHYLVCFNSLANLPLYIPLTRSIHSRFWMQPNMVIAMFLGIGLARMQGNVVRSLPSFLPTWTSRFVVIASSLGLVGLQMSTHYPQSNHSKSGVVISSYGNALLDTLPPNSVLLSYTDINWNSVRYLQECEKKRPDVTHLNFQLMPYSWYSRQHDLYPGITFPPLIQGVSTERGSKGFEQLTRRFVMQNMYALNMYLDLHAVNESALGKDGYYNGFYVTPHGMLWKIHEQKKMPTYSTWNKESKALFRMYNQSFALAHSAKYPTGSWEYVARKIYFDGLYQKALHSLQYWIDRTAKKGKDVTYDDLDGYMFGLRDIVKALNGIYHIALPAQCVTYPRKDIVKNLALTYVRYHGALVLAERQPARDLPISKQLVHDVKVEAVRISNEFLELSPKDKDIEVFQTFVDTVDNPEATAAEASAKKVKKTKKKKARPHQVVEEEL
ncbi:hypothetical protein H310_07603 [Aphanomyces invadans]|uniref:DUF2723 domain-containing protein n=1 Tax=Aphanomyces invadans TaxID=157072 RepID=A0A024U199_9STRA|nr:hypothetical protein H310_07603 [Aphanomyces invadans]ETW00206.1 hypothetical protein H310_07603 [Aphanomyces invadans]|eukprot:XP_008871231.1 hypothetical protein H310_07603 [Aphanomyces invadans]